MANGNYYYYYLCAGFHVSQLHVLTMYFLKYTTINNQCSVSSFYLLSMFVKVSLLYLSESTEGISENWIREVLLC